MIDGEAKINARIRHPNVVQFLGVAKEPGRIYIVSELVDGCNMEDAIFDEERKREMGIGHVDKLFVAKQCVQAVAAYLHTLVPPVIHKDIKPANVSIRKNCFTTKLCDLGISKVKSLTAANTACAGNPGGTPAYIAPECLLAGKKATAATDIRSLAITLIEFFIEEDAWSVDDEVDAVLAIQRRMKNEEIPHIPSATQCSDQIRKTITMCVHYNPGVRPCAVDFMKAF
ncbi:dual specificity protein kinase shkC-like [Lineus longissimus]|uniref:dual specificity protein kinase shkC-like n=1 Tax=Lineus longissimus TaxID=88925 RepID=UPI00315CFAFF